MTETVTVTLHLPRWLYRVLFRQAERHETQVHRLIVDGLIRSFRTEAPKPIPVRGPAKRPYTRVTTSHVKQIAELNAKGWADAQIAEHLDISHSSAARIRRDVLKLAAPPRGANP